MLCFLSTEVDANTNEEGNKIEEKAVPAATEAKAEAKPEPEDKTPTSPQEVYTKSFLFESP